MAIDAQSETTTPPPVLGRRLIVQYIHHPPDKHSVWIRYEHSHPEDYAKTWIGIADSWEKASNLAWAKFFEWQRVTLKGLQ